MLNARRILSRSLLAAGVSGFPVGIISFIKNTNFEQKLYPIIDEINKEEAFLEESRNEKQKIEAETKSEIETINGLQAELASENKTASEGIGAQTKSVAEELKKTMMVKLQPCKEKDKLGLKEISKTFEVQNQTISMTYCYSPECDQNLFSKKANWLESANYDNIIGDTWFSRACYSVIINHDVNAQKIKGSIQWGLKHDFAYLTNRDDHKQWGWRGVLFATEFEFSNGKTSDKFKNKFVILRKDGNAWKTNDSYNDWDDTYKNKYTYDDFKNKLTGGYNKLDAWKVDTNSGKSSVFPQDSQIIQLFSQGSDLWNWDSFKNRYHSTNGLSHLEMGKDIIQSIHRKGVWTSLLV